GDRGLASGRSTPPPQPGAALGVAVLPTPAAASPGGLRATSPGSAAALAAGYRLAFATGTGLAVAAIIVAAALLWPRTRPAPRPAPAADTRRDTPCRVPG